MKDIYDREPFIFHGLFLHDGPMPPYGCAAGSTTPAATTGRAHSIIDSILVFLISVTVVIVIIVVIVVVVVGVVVSLLLLLLLLFLKFIKNSAEHIPK